MGSPVPAWAVSQIFLSGDLLTSVFSTLELEDCQAARVCLAWHEAWIATREGRRGLRDAMMPAASTFLSGFDGRPLPDSMCLVADPDGEFLLVGKTNNGAFGGAFIIMDAVGRTAFKGRSLHVAKLAAFVSMNRIYTVRRDADDKARLFSYALANGFPMVAENAIDLSSSSQDLNLYEPAPAAGLLFGIASSTADYDDGQQIDEIVAFDAHTLEFRCRFGKDVFAKSVDAMAVVGEELYVAERQRGCLQVFSLAGEHLRTIARGDWRQPGNLLHFDGRLYLVECDGDDEDHGDDVEEQNKAEKDWSEDRKAAGMRIFVLNLQGETLQVWKPAGNDFDYINGMYVLGRKLLVSTNASFFALKGL